MTDPSKGMLLYHLTHIDNVASILKHGLVSRKTMRNKFWNQFTDVADPEIIKSREEHNDHLLDCVLFHFYARTPFDGAVCQRYGSENMAFIAVYRTLCNKQDFYVIPTHPLDKEEPEILPYEEGFQKVRWDILDNVNCRDYHDQEIKNACMAECITDSMVHASDIAYIFVCTDEARARIQKSLGHLDSRIKVRPNMFPRF